MISQLIVLDAVVAYSSFIVTSFTVSSHLSDLSFRRSRRDPDEIFLTHFEGLYQSHLGTWFKTTAPALVAPDCVPPLLRYDMNIQYSCIHIFVNLFKYMDSQKKEETMMRGILYQNSTDP